MDDLTDRELATVLAALRFWQRRLGRGERVESSPEHFGWGLEPLDEWEIDDLCERLNRDEEAA